MARWAPSDGAWFFDPFCGSGSVSRLARRLYPAVPHVVGDANPWLASIFEAQREPYAVPDNYLDFAYWRGLRDVDLPTLSVQDRATRFGVCLLTAWGNRWESHPDGRFRSTINPKFCEPTRLRAQLEALFSLRWLTAGDQALAADWKVTLQEVRAGDLVYIDPPYPETLGYGNQWWTIGDLLDVVDWAAASEASIVVSNVYAVERLFRRVGFEVRQVRGPAATKTRRGRDELLAWRFSPTAL